MRWWAFLIRVEVLRVQERSSEMWTPRNLKLATRSTSVPLIQIGVCAPPFVLLKSTMSSLVCFSVESQVVVGTPLCQVLNLLPVGRLIVVADETNHRCVICKLYNGIRTMYSCAVVGEEGVEERAQHAA